MLSRLVSLSVCGLAVLCYVVGFGVEPTCSIANGKSLEAIRGGTICADGQSMSPCPIPVFPPCAASTCTRINNIWKCKQVKQPPTNPPQYLDVFGSNDAKTQFSMGCTVGTVGQAACNSTPEPCYKSTICDADNCVVDPMTGNKVCQTGANPSGTPYPNFLPAGPSCNSTSFPIASQRPTDSWVTEVAANNGLWHRVFEIN